jgi:L-iditol 2-dehydrogenase
LNLCENKTVLGVSVNGGFAEYAKCKYTSAHILPPNVSYEDGALTEPLACCFYAVKNLQIEPGMTCVLLGPGPIGLMMVQLIKASGAGKLIVVGAHNDDYRLNLALQLGADVVLNSAEVKSKHYCKDVKERIASLTDGKFANRVITPTGAVAAMEQALEISGRRSIIVYFGLPGAKDFIRVPALQSIFWDKTIRFSWLAAQTWPPALQALATGLVKGDKLITHSFKLANLVDGLDRVRRRADRVIKAIVKP